MIKLISSKVACFLCKDEEHKDNYELYEYAVYIILSSAFHILTIIILGLCFNLLVESLVFYFSFIAIRKFAGGYHAKTPLRCYLFSIISSVVVLWLIKWISAINTFLIYIFIIPELLCLMLILFISPLDTESNPLNVQEKKKYRMLASIISIFLFIISTLFVFMGYRNIGSSMICGVIMSALVLLMRKIQAMKNYTKSL